MTCFTAATLQTFLRVSQSCSTNLTDGHASSQSSKTINIYKGKTFDYRFKTIAIAQHSQEQNDNNSSSFRHFSLVLSEKLKQLKDTRLVKSCRQEGRNIFTMTVSFCSAFKIFKRLACPRLSCYPPITVYVARMQLYFTSLSKKSIIRYQLSNQLLRCWATAGGFRKCKKSP